MLLSISRIRGNQTVKFGQLIEYNKINIFLKNHAENETGKLFPDHFLCFKKALYGVKASGVQIDFIIFR